MKFQVMVFQRMQIGIQNSRIGYKAMRNLYYIHARKPYKFDLGALEAIDLATTSLT